MNNNGYNGNFGYGMGTPGDSTFGVKENTAAVLTLVGTAVLLLVPKLCWLAWVLPLVVLLVERQSFYVKKCAAHGLATTIVAMAFMGLCGSLFVVSGTMTAGNLIAVISQGTERDDWPMLVGMLVVTLTGILIMLVIRIVNAIFLSVAAYKAWRYNPIRIPIASSLVKLVNQNYQ